MKQATQDKDFIIIEPAEPIELPEMLERITITVCKTGHCPAKLNYLFSRCWKAAIR
jgi:hypothetical protein